MPSFSPIFLVVAVLQLLVAGFAVSRFFAPSFKRSKIIVLLFLISILSSASYFVSFFFSDWAFVGSGSEFFSRSRYIEWSLSTPIIIGIMTYMGIKDSQKNLKYLLLLLPFVQILTILLGAGTELTDVSSRWILFACSGILFISMLAVMKFKIPKGWKGAPSIYRSKFKDTMKLLFVLWPLYPLVWFFTHFEPQLFSLQTGEELYAVMDFFSKGLFTFLLLYNPFVNSEGEPAAGKKDLSVINKIA